MSARVQRSADDRAARPMTLGSLDMIVDARGGLWIERERILVVSDLHLEKGSSFARRGQLVPPYDTGSTLAALAAMVMRWSPRRIVALGDSFHDDGGPARLSGRDADALSALQAGRDWLWIAGNHDPSPPGLAGETAQEFALGDVVMRHAPSPFEKRAQIAGHLHPCAKVVFRGRGLRRRCFVADGRALVMPALGAYAGGLNLRDRAFDGLFEETTLVAHLLGDAGLYSFPAAVLLPD